MGTGMAVMAAVRVGEGVWRESEFRLDFGCGFMFMKYM